MMWPSRQEQKRNIVRELRFYSENVRLLPGIVDARAVDALGMQFVASIRREDYFAFIQTKRISPNRANPNHESFNAERAVAYHKQQGNVDEAAWLVFLMTYFGKPADTGWLRLKDVYGMMGDGILTWEQVSRNLPQYLQWLAQEWERIRGRFGSHRKYESLCPTSRRYFGNVVESYVNWIGCNGHGALIRDVVHRTGNNPCQIFDRLYQEMSVISFGRLGKFDYLAMLGRYEIAPIRAGLAYLQQATGPKMGARLLFDGRRNGASSPRNLQHQISALDERLRVGMQVFEDALCNWQKNPLRFVHFRG